MNLRDKYMALLMAFGKETDMKDHTGTFVATATNYVQQFEHGLGRTPIMVVISLNPELYTIDELKGFITSFVWTSKSLRKIDESTITVGGTFACSNNVTTSKPNIYIVNGMRDTPATTNDAGASYADDSIFQAISPEFGNDRWKTGAEYTWWAF